MKHHSTGRRGLFFKINARKKGIALILIVSLALPYVSTAFLEQYEQHRSHQAAEQLQEKLQLSLDEQNAALDHFSELVTRAIMMKHLMKSIICLHWTALIPSIT